MNKVIISGFIAKIETRVINDTLKVCEFSIPYNVKTKDKEVTHWFNLKAYNQTADFIEKWFEKGKGIECEGKLLTQSWEKDGVKHTNTYIQVDNVSFPPARKAETQPAPEPKTENGKINVDENPITENSDLPF